jgi:hypothetical protein
MWRGVILAAISLVVLGCGKPAPPPRLVAIKGRILYQNQPVKGATVTFIPDLKKGNRFGLGAEGKTGDDGSFTLQTYPHGQGAMSGWYKVTCMVLDPAAIPVKYRSLQDTTLAVEVPEAGVGNLTLTLED